MGIYFKKRINLKKDIGLNLSKKGAGLSVGKKGFKLSIGADGKKRIRGGKGGIYFDKTIGKSSTPLASVLFIIAFIIYFILTYFEII